MFIYLFNLSQFLSFCQFLIGSSLRTVKNQDLIANYSMIEREEGVLFNVYLWSQFILKGIWVLLFQFHSIFNASSQLKTFSYPVISTILLFHTLWYAESNPYVYYFISFSLFFFHFWTLVPHRNGRKQKFKNQNIELGVLGNGFAEL